MRIRTVKPEFWQHEGLGALPRETRMLAAALLNWADDDGYFRSHPALVAGALLPFDADGQPFVARALPQLRDAGYVELYEGGVGRVASFREHQIINKPSKSRLAPKATHPLPPTHSGSTTGVLPEDYGSPTVALPEPSHTEVEVEREVEQGSRKQEEESADVAVAPPPSPAAAPTNRHASGSAYFAWCQQERHKARLVTELAPPLRKLSAWFSEVMLEFNGDGERLDAALEAFSVDSYWAARNAPFAAFMSQWRKYAPKREDSHGVWQPERDAEGEVREMPDETG